MSIRRRPSHDNSSSRIDGDGQSRGGNVRSTLAMVLVFVMVASTTLRMSPSLNVYLQPIIQEQSLTFSNWTQAAIGTASYLFEAVGGTGANGAVEVANKSTTASTTTPSWSKNGGYLGFPFHVLYAISGDGEGILYEFEVSLKSLLLNAPREARMDIHVMADQKAYTALHAVYEKIEITRWRSHQPVAIHTYNIQPFIRPWEQRLRVFFNRWWNPVPDVYSHHTVGTFFRFFANDALPANVSKFLYLDPDAIVFANLQGLWRHFDRKPNAILHWGRSQCNGFILLDNQRLDELWELAAHTNMSQIQRDTNAGINDQLVSIAINFTYPNVTGILDDAWDISVANNAWRMRLTLLEKGPDAGMIHFNGGAGESKSIFVAHSFLKDDPKEHQRTWGLAHYYERVPWKWARFWAKSLISTSVVDNHTPLRSVHHKNNSTGTTDDDSIGGHLLILTWPNNTRSI